MDPRQVRFTTAKPPMTVTAWMGEDYPNVQSGYGGWQVVQRPRRLSLTQWTGRDPFTMDIPILIDDFMNNRSVEVACSTLERMGLPPTPQTEPPLVRVHGPVPHTDLDWVINDITWGDALRQPNTGYRLRAQAVVHLLHYVADDRLQVLPAAEQVRRDAATRQEANTRANGGPKANASHPAVIRARQGDTLMTIAARELGSYKRWTELRDLNNIRDPKSVTAGQRIRLR